MDALDVLYAKREAEAARLSKAGRAKEAAAVLTKLMEELTVADPFAPVAPVEYFFLQCPKEYNDAVNDIRERYLERLLDLTDLVDPQEIALQAAWRSAIHGLCPVPFATVKIERKGGRGANHDFLCQFLAAGGVTVVWTELLEFKHWATQIADLPQFLSIAEKDLPFPVTYAEHYYDRYLPAYVAADAEGLGAVALPDRATYCRRVYSAAYDSHPFFRAAYDRDGVAVEAKKAIVNESIRTFLDEHGEACDLAHLSGLLQAKQEGKVFLLWDGAGTFHVERLGVADVTAVEILGVRNGNYLAVRTASGRTLQLLLRWKNHKGVMYPAWQIKLARA